MSEAKDNSPRPKVEIAGKFDSDGSLARKLAKLQAMNSPGLTKAAEAIAAATATSTKAADIIASAQRSTAHIDQLIDASSHIADLVAMKEIEWQNMPEGRRTRAAEETAEALKTLVDDMIESRQATETTAQHLEVLVDATLTAAEHNAQREQAIAVRERKVDRRESWVLAWTIAGVLLAAIAAVASVIAIWMG